MAPGTVARLSVLVSGIMIEPKAMLTDGCFCPMPWTGLMYNFDGTVKNCIRSANPIGNIKDQSIQEILVGDKNSNTQLRMLSSQPAENCYPCYDLERGKKNFDIVSDRVFYIRELKNVGLDTYSAGNHDLHTVDVRWSRLCNFACVYCSAEFSSKWAIEVNDTRSAPSLIQVANFKKYVFDHAHQLRHVYMAGGEPLLIKENLEFLDLLAKVNPKVNLRINTNLSKVDTKIFERVCAFENVHWTVSLDEMGEEFEYVRYGGSWQDFLDNLNHIRHLSHKITFNMLHFALNYLSIFVTVDFLMSNLFHANSFVIGPLLAPTDLDIRHLPRAVLDNVRHELHQRINQHPGYLLEDSYRNLLDYIDQPFQPNITKTFDFLDKLDKRRGLDSRKIFPRLYELRQPVCDKQAV